MDGVIDKKLNELKKRKKPVLVSELFFFFLEKYNLKLSRKLIIKRCKEKGIKLF